MPGEFWNSVSCRVCPGSTWSDDVWATQCAPCDVCDTNQVMVNACTVDLVAMQWIREFTQ